MKLSRLGSGRKFETVATIGEAANPDDAYLFEKAIAGG